ncbi:hypothetical protein EG830_14815, partial [bacterium]|nr:hypothetical protein [bacterium]
MIPEPVGNEAVYLFLDELAADGVITLNGVVKQYNRLMIRQKLEEADELRKGLMAGGALSTGGAEDWEKSGNAGPHLTTRQKKELDFWLNIYSAGEPDGKFKLLLSPATAYYRDSLFSVTVSPIL